MIVVQWLRRVLLAIRFVVLYIVDLVRANLYVAWEVVTPTHYMTPAIVAVPIRVRDPARISLLANLISLTPGTLTIDISPEHDVMFVHGLHVRSREQLIADVRKLEDRILEVTT